VEIAGYQIVQRKVSCTDPVSGIIETDTESFNAFGNFLAELADVKGLAHYSSLVISVASLISAINCSWVLQSIFTLRQSSSELRPEISNIKPLSYICTVKLSDTFANLSEILEIDFFAIFNP
jgi:hypothetical protein